MRTVSQVSWWLLLFGLLLVALTLASSHAAVAAPAQGQSYIIVFEDGVSARAAAPAVAKAHGLQTGYVYEHALQGMSAVVPAGRLAALEKDPRVAYVEVDRMRTIAAQTVPTGVQRIFADANGNIDIDNTDDYRVDVDVAVIDTGIDLEHPDLNVFNSQSCLNSDDGGPPWARTYYCGAGGDDDHYHGTHVAGTIAAIDNGIGVVGVAPGARLWAVKVCDSNGSCPSSAIIAGIDYVAANAGSVEVANMSLGGSGYDQAEYDAIQGAVDAGVAFAVAAGNDDDDANNYSPAAFDNVLTVSALADFDGEPDGLGSPTCRTDQDDTLADFSNWGSAVQITAPGVCIYSTFPIEQGEYGTISGTSMASPHAAGALALLASSNNPSNATDVYNLYDDVITSGNFNWIDDSGDGTQEPLLDVSTFTAGLVATGDGGGTTDNPPTVSITNPTDGATVSGAVSVTSDATDDNGVSQVEFFVDGSSIGIDSDDSDGYSASWDTTAYADGGHTVEAVATDSAGQTASDSVSVTVDNSGGTTYPIDLSVNAYKVRGTQHADLTWSGATSTNVDVYRDGSVVATTANDGAYTDITGQKGGGSATYQVCEAGTTTCSNEVTANW
ncbi:MAG: S8 family serine peptidase [Candidatus Promineifilaceae bacterium]|nr:S8 family serine peptidase [Candidatus Promineifilaceae bacterium]